MKRAEYMAFIGLCIFAILGIAADNISTNRMILGAVGVWMSFQGMFFYLTQEGK